MHARMINFHQKYFIESIPYDKINPDKIRQNRNRYKNIDEIENKMTRFQIYPKTELACNYKTPLYKHNIQNFSSNTKKVLT